MDLWRNNRRSLSVVYGQTLGKSTRWMEFLGREIYFKSRASPSITLKRPIKSFGDGQVSQHFKGLQSLDSLPLCKRYRTASRISYQQTKFHWTYTARLRLGESTTSPTSFRLMPTYGSSYFPQRILFSSIWRSFCAFFRCSLVGSFRSKKIKNWWKSSSFFSIKTSKFVWYQRKDKFGSKWLMQRRSQLQIRHSDSFWASSSYQNFVIISFWFWLFWETFP